jgi:hypothetical protein
LNGLYDACPRSEVFLRPGEQTTHLLRVQMK